MVQMILFAKQKERHRTQNKCVGTKGARLRVGDELETEVDLSLMPNVNSI